MNSISLNNSEEILKSLGNSLMGVKVRKVSIGWGLEEVEAAARLAVEGERESDSDDETTDGSEGT